MQFEIRVGDKVQARLVNGESVIAVTEFVVTGIDADTVLGCPIGPLGPTWEIELVRRGEVALPTTLSDLAAWLVESPSEPTRIVGPLAGTWQTQNGRRIDPKDVLDWKEWSDEYLPEQEIILPPAQAVAETEEPSA